MHIKSLFNSPLKAPNPEARKDSSTLKGQSGGCNCSREESAFKSTIIRTQAHTQADSGHAFKSGGCDEEFTKFEFTFITVFAV
ncbi:hypothetical protein GQX74_000769 [Glossina fuscipes]|nr:hypothetical protein GQX74_000769 [Glossina fuscipes]